MGHGTPLTFKLARCAHGSRNWMDTYEEIELQAEAQKRREVLLPGVDIATAWAMVRSATPPMGVRRLGAGAQRNWKTETVADPEARQVAADTALAESGFAVFIPERWDKLHHVVRYFELIERNEAPDTSLLEWLVSAGAVPRDVVAQTTKHFKSITTLGRHAFVMDPEDLMRLDVAAEVREQLVAEEAAERAKALGD